MSNILCINCTNNYIYKDELLMSLKSTLPPLSDIIAPIDCIGITTSEPETSIVVASVDVIIVVLYNQY